MTTVSLSGAAAANKLGPFDIRDTWSQIFDNFATLATYSNLRYIYFSAQHTSPVSLKAADYLKYSAVLAKIKSTFYLTVTGASLQRDSSRLNADPHVKTYSVSIAAANIVYNLKAFETNIAAGKLAAIKLSDKTAPTLSITASQYLSHSAVWKLVNGGYLLKLSGAKASQVAGLSSNAHVTSLTVSDSGANVTANLSALVSAGAKLKTMTLTSVPTISWADYSAYSGVWSRLAAGSSVLVSAAPAGQTAALAGDAHVKSFTVSDTAAGFNQNFAALAAAAKTGRLTQTTLIDTVAQSLTVRGADFAANPDLWQNLGGNYTLNVTDALASQAQGLVSNKYVASFTVNDTAAHVVANADLLRQADRRLTGITLNKSDSNNLWITSAAYQADADVWAKISPASPATMVVDGASIDQMAGLNGDSRVYYYSLADSFQNVSTQINYLQQNVNHISAISLISAADAPTPRFSMSSSQFMADRDALDKLNTRYDLSITDGHTVADALNPSRARSSAGPYVINDNIGNVVAHIDELEALFKKGLLDGIAVKTSNGATQTLDSRANVTDADVLGRMVGDYALTTNAKFQIKYLDSAPTTLKAASGVFQHALSTAAAVYGAEIDNDMTLFLKAGFGNEGSSVKLGGARQQANIFLLLYCLT